MIISAVLGGGIAAVAGFGIGSLITPVLALDLGIRLAVAVVALPHLVATAARFWVLRHRVDRTVFFRFGIASAAGGFLGAAMQALVAPTGLVVLFGSGHTDRVIDILGMVKQHTTGGLPESGTVTAPGHPLDAKDEYGRVGGVASRGMTRYLDRKLHGNMG